MSARTNGAGRDGSGLPPVEEDSSASLHALYAPPSSRPAAGGVVPSTGHPLWVGFGLGWAAIGFTFLWVGVAFPLFVRFFSSIATSAVAGLVWLALLVAPTLALGGYFALRRQWKRLLGMALACVSAILAAVLLVALILGIGGAV